MPSSTAGLHKLFVLWMCVLVLSQVCTGRNCKDGSIKHNDTCYVYIHETYNWFEAKVACVALGGRIVEFDKPDKNNFVARMVSKHGGPVWTGVTDFAQETLWRQSSDAHADVNICQYWGNGQPNNIGFEEDCAIVCRDGTWHDYNCITHQANVLCEILNSVSSPAAWPGSSWRCPNKPYSSSPLHGISLLHVLLSTAVGFRLTIGSC